MSSVGTAPLRILLASFIEDRPTTGMGRWTRAIASALERTGHEVTCWYAADFPRCRASGRWSVILFPIALASRIVRERSRFDAVVIHEPAGFWYGLLRHAFRNLPPMIAMAHGIESKQFAELKRHADAGRAAVSGFTRVVTPLARLWQSDASLALADSVVCLSTEDLRYAFQRLHVPPERSVLMVNGVSPPGAETAKVRAPKSVLFLGSWIDRKGRRILPELWHRVRALQPGARLTVAGTGVGQELVRSAFHPTDRSSVAVIEHIERDAELWGLYSRHAFFVLPSLGEGSPLALLEAMVAGLPCVAASVGGVPDILTDGVHGLLFDPSRPADGADLLAHLMEDEDLAHAVGTAAGARARALTWDAAAGRLLEAAHLAVSGSR